MSSIVRYGMIWSKSGKLKESFTSCRAGVVNWPVRCKRWHLLCQNNFRISKKATPKFYLFKGVPDLSLKQSSSKYLSSSSKLNRSGANKGLGQLVKNYCAPKTGHRLPTSLLAPGFPSELRGIRWVGSVCWSDWDQKWMEGEGKSHFRCNLDASRWCVFLHLYLLWIFGNVSASHDALNKYFY